MATKRAYDVMRQDDGGEAQRITVLPVGKAQAQRIVDAKVETTYSHRRLLHGEENVVVTEPTFFDVTITCPTGSTRYFIQEVA